MKYFISLLVFLAAAFYSDRSYAFFKPEPFNDLDKVFDIKVLEMIKSEFKEPDSKDLPKKELLIKRLKELDKERRLI